MTIKQNHLTESDVNRLVGINKTFLHNLLAHEKQLKDAAAKLFAQSVKGTELGEAAFVVMNQVRDARRKIREQRIPFERIQRNLKKMQRGQ